MLFIITKETIGKMKNILESYPDIDPNTKNDLMKDLDNLHPLNVLMSSNDVSNKGGESCRI